jgi:hypothetical protein
MPPSKLARHGRLGRCQTLRCAGAYAASALLALAAWGAADAAARNWLRPDSIRARLTEIGIVTTSDAGGVAATADRLDNVGLAKGAPLLAQLGRRLQSIDLSGTQVTKVDTLKGLTALTSLDLARTQIADIDALKGLTALHALNLSGTPVGKGGFRWSGSICRARRLPMSMR